MNQLNRQTKLIYGLILALFGILTALVGYSFFAPDGYNVLTQRGSSASNLTDVRSFSSADDFRDYLTRSESSNFVTNNGGSSKFLPEAERDLTAPNTASSNGGPTQRVSQTNVQVTGVDEPDILKTDGKNIFFSRELYDFYPLYEAPIPLLQSQTSPSDELLRSGYMPQRSSSDIKVASAFPIENLKVTSTISKQGELLLDKSTLVIFQSNQIDGYDVSDPAAPKEKWHVDLATNSYLLTSRLYQGRLYVVTSTTVNFNNPCPYYPFKGDTNRVIACPMIYHPVAPVPTNVTFTVLELDPQSGQASHEVAFVGESGTSVVHMSNDNIYVTYSYYESRLRFLTNFYREVGRDLVNSDFISRLQDLDSYNISEQAKLVEFEVIYQNYLASLSQDDRLKTENEFSNRMQTFAESHKRELQQTGIVKVALNNLTIAASGSVPGSLLNQFALDEYQGNLRVATTVDASLFGSDKSTNDVYVFDNTLKQLGSVLDLGIDERIYSVRFIGPRGYVVTFKQIDPFFVLDLSNPSQPAKKGELKIPGYSSYLHSLNDTVVLGVGQENGQVKLALFDVSNASEPKQLDTYLLQEGWTEVSSNHHAFLLDADKNSFFLPGSNAGYIFSYSDNKLSLQKSVADIVAKRAMFIDHYMYVVGTDKIVVVDENNWERVKELKW